MSSPSRGRPTWSHKVTRDLVLFAVGLGLTIHESLAAGPERPSLYILYAGMMGLGPILRYAESRQKSKDEE